MNPSLALRFGLALGGAVFVWQVASAALLGSTPLFIPVATGIEAAVLIPLFALPAAGRPVGPRVATGALASAIGATIVFAGSLLVSRVLFPGLLASLGPAPPTALEAAGGGFMGTLVTGVALSAVLAFVQRNRAGG